MSRHITNTVAEMVHTALTDQGKDDFDYDVSMALVPGPQGNPQALIAVTLVVGAMTLGDNHSATVAIPPAVPDQQAVNDMVRQVGTGLLEAKTQAAQDILAQSNGHGGDGPTRLTMPGS